MENLSSIHIPAEVCQSSEAYLGQFSQKRFTPDFLGWSAFAKIVNGFYLLQKCSIVDLRLGSKHASRVVPLYSIRVIRILA